MIDRRDKAGPFCAYCGKTLGVYEPLIVLSHDRQVTRTSRLNHPDSSAAGVMVHEDCYERSQPWSGEHSP